MDSEFQEDDVKSVNSMKYLEGVLNEAMRLIPAGPLIFRKAIEDDSFGGYSIPKDVKN